MQASPEFFIPDSFPLGDGLHWPALSVSTEESQWFALKKNVSPVKERKKKQKKNNQKTVIFFFVLEF